MRAVGWGRVLRMLTLLLDDGAGDADGGVGGHLDGAETSSGEALFA